MGLLERQKGREEREMEVKREKLKFFILFVGIVYIILISCM